MKSKEEITKYIEKHYGSSDIEVVYGEGWRVPEKSTINCPFETIDDTEIFMQWCSPSHFGDTAMIIWGYIN